MADSKDKELAKIEKQLIKMPKDVLPSTSSVLSNKQVARLYSQTPKQFVKTRQGRGGQSFDYVPGGWVKRELDILFGFNWDFEIIEQGEKYGQIIVLGKLTVRTGEQTIVKTQAGRAFIKKLKNSDEVMDYGNDLKAAITDALKKCASELGIARDIYNREEFVEAELVDAQLQEETEQTENTRALTEEERAEIKKELEDRGVTESMKIIKSVTGRIKLGDDTTDHDLRQIKQHLDEG